MRRLFVIGGIVSGVLLILFGLGSIWISANGYMDVRDSLEREGIVGSPDMEPEATRAAVEESGAEIDDLPDCDVAGEEVSTGSEARCFADYMRIHTLEATGGQTYAEMGRFLDESGKPTSDEAAAATDPKTGAPVENPARNIWISSTAFQTALNTAYFAENVATFAIVMGVALLLAGVGFLVLTVRLLGRTEETPATASAPRAAVAAS